LERDDDLDLLDDCATDASDKDDDLDLLGDGDVDPSANDDDLDRLGAVDDGRFDVVVTMLSDDASSRALSEVMVLAIVDEHFPYFVMRE
jgi:hypothetical protein